MSSRFGATVRDANPVRQGSLVVGNSINDIPYGAAGQVRIMLSTNGGFVVGVSKSSKKGTEDIGLFTYSSIEEVLAAIKDHLSSIKVEA